MKMKTTMMTIMTMSTTIKTKTMTMTTDQLMTTDQWEEIFRHMAAAASGFWKCDICQLIAVDFTQNTNTQLHKYTCLQTNTNTHDSGWQIQIHE